MMAETSNRAGWGAFEEPRQCKLCGSIFARCNGKREIANGVIIRARICSDCGRHFDTWENPPPPLPKSPPAIAEKQFPHSGKSAEKNRAFVHR
jgi:predicted  nucleic acid-binding Zn-ribbon protein